MSEGMRALVVADTHLSAATLHRMPEEVWERARDADVVLHCGDVVDVAVLEAFAELAPTHAVLGNNDRGLERRLPEVLELELAGSTIGMVHDSGPTSGRNGRMARRFPDAQVVLFGHSHDPLVARTEQGQLLVNPGSPTQRRRQPVHTVAELHLHPDGSPTAKLIPVGPLAIGHDH